MTRLDRQSPGANRGLNHKIVVTGKSVIAINRVMMESLRGNLQTILLTSVSKKNLIEPRFNRGTLDISVPQTDTGGLVENTKAIGRKWFKELGKIAGRNLWEMPCLDTTSGPQQKTLTGCLTKTQVSAKPKGNV
jgi:hypothetical protein